MARPDGNRDLLFGGDRWLTPRRLCSVLTVRVARFCKNEEGGSTQAASAEATLRAFRDVMAVGAGHLHILAVLADGSVRAWGSNSYGHGGHYRRHISRYLTDPVRRDLARKMVLVGGLRQVGKTTFALGLLESGPKDETDPACLNWDFGELRERLLAGGKPAGRSLLILDKIHEFARWSGLVKGLRDTRRSKQSIVVIGSARLDY